MGTPVTRNRRAVLPLAPALVLALVASACSSSSSNSVSVKMESFKFTPLHIGVTTDQAITFDNASDVTHNFTILRGSTAINLDVAAGTSATTEQIGKLLTPGDYPFECKYHKNRGMIGLLTVTAPGP